MGSGRRDRKGIPIIELLKFANDVVAERWFERIRSKIGPTCPDRPSGNHGPLSPLHAVHLHGARKRLSVHTGTVTESSDLGHWAWAVAFCMADTSIK